MATANSVLVTGSNRGIGLELVRQLVTRESPPQFVFAACRNPSAAKDLQKLGEEHSSIRIIELDLENEGTYSTAYAEVTTQVGDFGLDLLVNNAAILEEANLEQVTAENLTRSFKVNAVGPLLLTRTFLPLIKMAAGRSGKATKQAVVNVSSQMSSMHSRLLPGLQYPYKISKTALNSVSVQLADDLRSYGIIVISLCPGWVQTDMGVSNATLTPQQSVSGILKLIEKLSIEHSGGFYNHAEEKLEW